MAMNLGPRLQLPKSPDGQEQITDIKPFDAQAESENFRNALAHSPEVEALTAQIDINDLTTIVSFGKESAEEVSRASDSVLRSMNINQINDTGKLLTALSRVMDEFNIEEITENPSLLSKLFGGMKKQMEKVLEKYSSMGDEVDKIYVQLKQYEREIIQSNNKLEEMFRANLDYYRELVKYIVAGEQGCQEITDYMEQRQRDLEATGDDSIRFELQTLEQARDMLEQRTQDLRTAELVAMQTIPMLRTTEVTNMNLVRKINSAFIITLPVFKQALAQAIMIKRQKIQAEALSALDKRTNEMLLKNAKSTVDQSRLAAQMSAGSSIKVETLENTWKTIVDGINETRKIQDDAARKRAEDQVRLEKIKRDFNARFSGGAR